MQVDRPERGFSYARQAPLDMRMDPDQPISAATLVAESRRPTWRVGSASTVKSATHARSRARRPARAVATDNDTLAILSRSCGRPFRRGRCLRVVIPPSASFRHCGLWSMPNSNCSRHSLESAFDLLASTVCWRSSAPLSRGPTVKRSCVHARRAAFARPGLPVSASVAPRGALAVNGRAVMPSAPELHRNPRSRSARLRAVRKLEAE